MGAVRCVESAGGGDVKMLFAAGIIVGFRFSFVELLFVSVSGLILGIVMLCFGLVASRRLIHYIRVFFDWRYDRKKGASELPPKQDEKGRIAQIMRSSINQVGGNNDVLNQTTFSITYTD